ncbi:MAG TPA: metalloregulator ArsR/SmtB family transcription factor [Steroidobacteraceae bacterium]|nr:metalloregulator ArsR/SmtB family transcription factor [Steroidobacteraceae bacterium]
MDNNSSGMDLVFHALSDGTRREILRRLAAGPASVSELAQPFRMALPSLLKHLGVLESAGAVVSRKRGRTRTCWLRPAALLAGEHWLSELRRPAAPGFD